MTFDSAADARDQLVRQIRDAVARGDDAAATSRAVATVLRDYLTVPGLVPESARASDPDAYRQNLLHVEDDGSFSIVALVWLPGQRTPVHDHVSWCVVGVYEGDETEIRYRVAEDATGEYLVKAGTGVNENGSVEGFAPPGDLHEVWNSGDGLAISIHVYGADIRKLGSSIRRRYDLPVRDA